MTVTNTGNAPNGARSYQWYADGKWHDAPAVFDDCEPYSGAVYAQAPDCGAEEARLAVAAAHGRSRVGRPPPAEKALLFFKAAEIVRRRRDEIAGNLATKAQVTDLGLRLQMVAGVGFEPTTFGLRALGRMRRSSW